MLVVYGIKHKIKNIKSLGINTCENCGHKVETTLCKETGYIHVYYIPLLPYLGGFKFISCPNCGISKVLDKEEFKRIKDEE